MAAATAASQRKTLTRTTSARRLGEDCLADVRERAKCGMQGECEGYQVERTAAPAGWSLLIADVQPDHRSSGFADDTIAVAAPATFEPSFRREIASQESKQDCKNNQACDTKQHRIVKVHGTTVVSGHRLVKHVRPAARFFPRVRSTIEAGTASSPRSFSRTALR